MNWKPNNITREAVGEFLENMVSVLPAVMGIDEVIAGCQVINLDPYGVGLGTYPRYIQVALRDRYYQDVMYRGGLTGLAVGDYVTVVHMRDGNRYELMTAGGSTGTVVNPAPAEADYVVTAGDPLLTNAHVTQAGQWTVATVAAGTFQADFHPDLPVVVTAAGAVTEYATIQLAITAATAGGDTVLIPPGDYTEDITLANGVCVKGFGPRAEIRILGDEDVVTTVAGGWLENVTIVVTDPDAGAFAGVRVSHTDTCRMRNITIEVSQTTDNRACGIAAAGASDGLLVIDEVDITVVSSGDADAYGAYFLSGSYELEMKNFKIVVTNSNASATADAYGIYKLGSTSVKATEGWIYTDANGGVATDLYGAIIYSEIVNTSDDTVFWQNVGVGTPTPGYPLEINRAVGNSGAVVNFVQNTAEGYYFIQENGVNVGGFEGFGSNFAVAARRNVIAFTASVNNLGGLAFITQTAGTYYDRMTIINSGEVGIGVVAPETNLSFEPALFTASVEGIKWQHATATTDSILQAVRWADGIGLLLSSNYYINVAGAGARFNAAEESAAVYVDPRGYVRIYTGTNAGLPTLHLEVAPTGVVTMSNYGVGDAQFLAGGVITSVSDRSLKRDIRDTEIGLAEVLRMQGKRWRFTEESGLNDKDDTVYQGFIADDVEKIVPAAVGRDPQGMRTMSYSSLMPAFAMAIQELDTRLGKLEMR